MNRSLPRISQIVKLALLLGLSAIVVLISTAPAQAATVTQYSLEQHGNTITQTFLISRPTLIPLTFGYCDGQTCGNPLDPDLDCYLNLYNPNFTDAFPDTISIGPLGHGQPTKLFLKAGNLAGFDLKYGYYDPTHQSDWNKSILSTQPTFNPDGSVTLSFNQGPIQAFKDFKKSPRGRICGITKEQLENFKKQYGTAFDNVNQAAIKISIVWQVDNPQYANPYDQTLTVNGQPQSPFQVPLSSLTPTTTPSVSHQTTSTNTVAAATTTLLNNLNSSPKSTSWLQRLGFGSALAASSVSSRQVSDVDQALKTANVFNQAGQADWKALQSYLTNTEHLNVQEVDATTLLRSLDQTASTSRVQTGQLGLVAWTIHESGKPPRESMLVIFGSDSKGNLIVGDPTSHRTEPNQMSYETFFKGNPWLLLVSHQ